MCRCPGRHRRSQQVASRIGVDACGRSYCWSCVARSARRRVFGVDRRVVFHRQAPVHGAVFAVERWPLRPHVVRGGAAARHAHEQPRTAAERADAEVGAPLVLPDEGEARAPQVELVGGVVVAPRRPTAEAVRAALAGQRAPVHRARADVRARFVRARERDPVAPDRGPVLVGGAAGVDELGLAAGREAVRVQVAAAAAVERKGVERRTPAAPSRPRSCRRSGPGRGRRRTAPRSAQPAASAPGRRGTRSAGTRVPPGPTRSTPCGRHRRRSWSPSRPSPRPYRQRSPARPARPDRDRDRDRDRPRALRQPERHVPAGTQAAGKRSADLPVSRAT